MHYPSAKSRVTPAGVPAICAVFPIINVITEANVIVAGCPVKIYLDFYIAAFFAIVESYPKFVDIAKSKSGRSYYIGTRCCGYAGAGFCGCRFIRYFRTDSKQSAIVHASVGITPGNRSCRISSDTCFDGSTKGREGKDLRSGNTAAPRSNCGYFWGCCRLVTCGSSENARADYRHSSHPFFAVIVKFAFAISVIFTKSERHVEVSDPPSFFVPASVPFTVKFKSVISAVSV